MIDFARIMWTAISKQNDKTIDFARFMWTAISKQNDKTIDFARFMWTAISKQNDKTNVQLHPHRSQMIAHAHYDG